MFLFIVISNSLSLAVGVPELIVHTTCIMQLLLINVTNIIHVVQQCIAYGSERAKFSLSFYLNCYMHVYTPCVDHTGNFDNLRLCVWR